MTMVWLMAHVSPGPTVHGGDFGGTIGRYHWESTPAWPEDPVPPPDAPNVVLIVLDDVGFAQLGCFGSDIATPNLDALAAGGLRYRNFHTTALCSPTRACLLTGRNHHANGMGRIIDLAMGYPGYNARIPKANGLLPEMLVPHGYAAYAVGKWHLTPRDEHHLGARRDRWPLGRGFERYYGFFDGETHQFAPALVQDNQQVDQPRTYEDGYHLTEDLVDHAIDYLIDLRNVDPHKPFLLYLATGACHSPHQSPAAWRDRYRGRFDRGWDEWRDRTFARQVAEGIVPPGTELTPRPDWVPAWDTLSADTQRVYARFMEAFAAFLSHADHELGRLFDHLRTTGEFDDTLIMVVSDNGASSEGGPTGSLNDLRAWNMVPRTVAEALERIDEIGGPSIHNNYPWGWTVAGNTPFKRWKREVHEGGVADPLLVSWPARIADAGSIRDQYVHAIDLTPTILAAIGVEPPDVLGGVAQRPFDGVSFLATLSTADAPDRHTTQYYEMFGSQAIYHDGWKAVTYHPMQTDEPGLEGVAWELYHVAVDRSECRDLAGDEPARLAEMIDLWWREAERNQVLPLDNRAFSERVVEGPHRRLDRPLYVYRPARGMIPEDSAVDVRNRTHTVTARVSAGPTGSDGVLLMQGSNFGGWALYVQEDRLRYDHNVAGHTHHTVVADQPIGPGDHVLAFSYINTGWGAATVELSIDGAPQATADLAPVLTMRTSITGHGLTIGHATGLPVTDAFAAPFAYAGTIHEIAVDLDGPPHIDPDEEVEHAVRRQ